MHLVTIETNGHAHPGVIAGDEVLDLSAAGQLMPDARSVPPTIRGLLAAGAIALDRVRDLRDQALEGRGSIAHQLRESGALLRLDQVRLRAPIEDPGMVLAGGMNYHEHLKEMNTPAPDRPVSFVKSSAAIIGPADPIILPPACPDMVDWEGEFSAVFGRECHNVSADDALQYIAGYTLINDVSARDWVAPIFQAQGVMGPIHAWEHNLLGKQFPTFCPLGPVIATADEIADPGKVNITTTLNGQTMQSACTDDLVFSLPQLIEYYSRFYRLMPGDIITTGSPSGVGYGRNPKVFMRAGDVVAVRVAGIGTLSNRVVAS